MSQREGTVVGELRDHWGGRSRGDRVAWALTFAGQAEFWRVVTGYQRALQDLSCLDLVPMDALQLTLVDVGDAESVGEDRVAELLAAAGDAVGRMGAVRLSFEAASVVPDGVSMVAAPVAGLEVIREALPGGSGDGGDVSGDTAVAIAYSNEATTAAFVRATVGFVAPVAVTVTVSAVDLVRFDGRYRSADLTSLGRVSLG